ncbi:hypothetical protein PR048_027034 [Dryococelus australis]|uniref:Uncharacterized protein n=1 Tax=Dryococelus australis TaxID=614101 RepID=A0ABQ9GEA8_9NEOP|nr:hypothetical protein PR048_027034 [Dryococelus australis]
MRYFDRRRDDDKNGIKQHEKGGESKASIEVGRWRWRSVVVKRTAEDAKGECGRGSVTRDVTSLGVAVKAERALRFSKATPRQIAARITALGQTSRRGVCLPLWLCSSLLTGASIPDTAIVISLFHCFQKSLQANARMCPHYTPSSLLLLLRETSSVFNDLAVDETSSTICLPFCTTSITKQCIWIVFCFGCRRKCYDKHTTQPREQVFANFRQIRTKDEQDIYLQALITASENVREICRRILEAISKASFVYDISTPSGKMQIYKLAFMNHAITSEHIRRLPTLLIDGKVPMDRRDKCTPGNTKPDCVGNAVKEHISSFPVKIAHYSTCEYHYLSERLNVLLIKSLVKIKQECRRHMN